MNGADHALEHAGYGIHEATVDAGAGDDYEFVLDGKPLPDPCSRWQPEGLRGPSRVVDTTAFEWTDGGFRIPGLPDAVIYELHIGTFSPEGTFAGAIPYLQGLAELGVTAIEVMPVAEFPGRHGWGYDGVYLSATQSSYGGPLEFMQARRRRPRRRPGGDPGRRPQPRRRLRDRTRCWPSARTSPTGTRRRGARA